MLRNHACAKKSSNTKISLPVWATCSQKKHMTPGRELQYTNLHTIDKFPNMHCFILKTCTTIYYPFIGSILQSRDIVMHPENGPKVWYIPMLYGHVKSTKEIFSTSLRKDPLGHHHATHHVFPILDVEYFIILMDVI
jgi:hypothetical protein